MIIINFTLHITITVILIYSRITYISDNQIDHRTVRNLMESPIVKTVLSTGVDRQNVMQAIERRLRETGKGYIDRVSLISLRSCFLKLAKIVKLTAF